MLFILGIKKKGWTPAREGKWNSGDEGKQINKQQPPTNPTDDRSFPNFKFMLLRAPPQSVLLCDVSCWAQTLFKYSLARERLRVYVCMTTERWQRCSFWGSTARASPYSGNGHHPALWWALNTGRVSWATDTQIHMYVHIHAYKCWRAEIATTYPERSGEVYQGKGFLCLGKERPCLENKTGFRCLCAPT